MKNNRVNIDRDVRSRKNIAASRPASRRESEPKPKITEQTKDEPQEEVKEEAKAPKLPETFDAAAGKSPAPRPKKSGRPPEGEA